MSNEFTREERYIVFKLSDLGNPLKGDEIRKLAREYAEHLEQLGKKPLDYVVIAADWSEYGPTWKAVEARVPGPLCVPEESDIHTAARSMNLELIRERDALRVKVEAMEKQEPFDADSDVFRSAFEAALKAGNWPATRQGDDYRSPSTQFAWRITFSTVNRLKLYLAPGAQPAPSFADAYQGAMEDVAIWKKRALEAEDLNRKFVAEINGPAYTWEPTQPSPSVPVEAIGKMLADAMAVAVSNGANSVSMPDEYVEVAVWLRGISSQPTPARSA